MPKIICEISASDFASCTNPMLILQHWSDVISKKLIEAGIPIDMQGNILSGTLRRFDDPKDFGKCTYEWSSTKE